MALALILPGVGLRQALLVQQGEDNLVLLKRLASDHVFEATAVGVSLAACCERAKFMTRKIRSIRYSPQVTCGYLGEFTIELGPIFGAGYPVAVIASYLDSTIMSQKSQETRAFFPIPQR
jgi:hypothetical protein